MKFKFNGKALWINLEKYIQITAQGQRHALKKTNENIIQIFFLIDCQCYFINSSPQFLKGWHFSLECPRCNGLDGCSLCTAHWCVPLRCRESTDTSLGRTVTTGQPPHYAEYKHQSVCRERKTGEKIHHPSAHLDPLTQLWQCTMSAMGKWSDLFNEQILCCDIAVTVIDWATGTRPAWTGDQFINSDN